MNNLMESSSYYFSLKKLIKKIDMIGVKFKLKIFKSICFN